MYLEQSDSGRAINLWCRSPVYGFIIEAIRKGFNNRGSFFFFLLWAEPRVTNTTLHHNKGEKKRLCLYADTILQRCKYVDFIQVCGFVCRSVGGSVWGNLDVDAFRCELGCSLFSALWLFIYFFCCCSDGSCHLITTNFSAF